jgi:hypothetical protein
MMTPSLPLRAYLLLLGRKQNRIKALTIRCEGTCTRQGGRKARRRKGITASSEGHHISFRVKFVLPLLDASFLDFSIAFTRKRGYVFVRLAYFRAKSLTSQALTSFLRKVGLVTPWLQVVRQCSFDVWVPNPWNMIFMIFMSHEASSIISVPIKVPILHPFHRRDIGNVIEEWTKWWDSLLWFIYSCGYPSLQQYPSRFQL